MTDGIVLLTIFVLSAFAGYEVISKVSTILHTPLMSGANAIHGVILVGAVLLAGRAETTAELVVGLIAVFLATLNMVGGFVVTDRMLDMFRVKRPAPAVSPAASPAVSTPAKRPVEAQPEQRSEQATRETSERWDDSLPADRSEADRND
jgi:H+-translocating NAD(P) transhydrogenase subunit alpha